MVASANLTLPETLQQRWGEPWLSAARADSFWSQLATFQAQFETAKPQDVLLAAPEPVRFLAAFFAAAQQPGRVWLANPHWGSQEWRQVTAQYQPDQVIGTLPLSIASQIPRPPRPMPHAQPGIQIPTGGSSGHIRFATHTWDTLTASVQGFCQHFACDRVSAYCVLPLYHVSGLMQALRCLLSGGQLVVQPFRELLAAGPLMSPLVDPEAHQFLSLVPTQLQRLLASDRDFVPWLRQFHAILLGGAPPWPSLLQTARDLQLPLAPTYGMTETAAQVATLLPQEFLAGHTGSGRSLPHAQLTIRDAADQVLPPNQVGKIAIAATSLALAQGQTPLTPPFQTGDLGYLDHAGFLHVIGRATSLIITGGEKVLPAEVEAAILATGLVSDCAVLGVPDADWGEQVVAVVVSAEQDAGTRLRQALQPQLSAYKIPKRWLLRAELPRNAQGKLNQAALRQWVMAHLGSTGVTTAVTPASVDGAGD